MKITAIEIHDFKRIRDVEIEPGARTLVLIGGKNTAGKSSILDAITAALGGGRALPADPIRHGADQAEIRVELDDNGTAVIVRRVIKPDGKGSVEVRRDGAPVGKPQAFLDQLVGARFLDPLAFLALVPGAQRAALLDLVDRDGVIAGLEKERAAHYDLRTDIGRDLKRATGALDSMPRAGAAPAEVDVEELAGRVNALQVEGGARATMLARIQDIASRDVRAQEDERRADDAVARALRDQDAARERRLAIAAEAIEADAESAAMRAERVIALDLAEAKAALAGATEANRAVAVAVAAAAARTKQAALVKKLEHDHLEAARAIERVDEAKAAFLEAAALPVPGLGVAADGVTYLGVPLAQASGAQRLRVALALAIAASPNLRDVWIRDASLLDEDHLALVAADAEAAGVRCWLERVGTADEDAIIIVDGEVQR